MTACHSGQCPHESSIAKLQQVDETLMTMLREMRDDLREMKGSMAAIPTMIAEAGHMKETIARAFSRLEVLEKDRAHGDDVAALMVRIKELEAAKDGYDAFINQVEGMKAMAWALWTILAGGLGVVIYRVTAMAGGV